MITKKRIWLAAWMERKGVDEDELAHRARVNRSTVNRWQSESRNPRWDNIHRIAAALGITPDQLMQPPPDPHRPSIDAILRDAPDDVVQKLADLAALWKTRP